MDYKKTSQKGVYMTVNNEENPFNRLGRVYEGNLEPQNNKPLIQIADEGHDADPMIQEAARRALAQVGYHQPQAVIPNLPAAVNDMHNDAKEASLTAVFHELNG
jgi:hypothetical protein